MESSSPINDGELIRQGPLDDPEPYVLVAGKREEATRYDAFGTALNLQSPGTGNDLLFTGRELDRSTGLY